MSYNESLRANSNYPPMTQSQWNAAPFNQIDSPEEAFKVAVSCSLSKDTEVISDDYDELDSYKGLRINNAWNAYVETEKTIDEILLFAKEAAQYFLSNKNFKVRPKYTLMKLAKSCEGWTVDEENAEQV